MAPKQQTRSKGRRAGMLLHSQSFSPSPKKAKLAKSPKHQHNTSITGEKPKKTVNINAMFDHPALKPAHEPVKPRNILSPAKAGVQNSTTRKPGFFSNYHAQKQEVATATPLPISNPDFFAEYRARQSCHSMGIAEAIEPYLENIHKSWQGKLQAPHKSLEAVRKGIDPKTGKKRPDLPTQEDFAKLAQEIDDLDHPVEDEMVQLEFERPGRSPVIKNVRLGDIRDKCIERVQRKRAQIDELREHQCSIENETAELRDQIVGDSEATKKAKKAHKAQLTAFNKEIKEVDAAAKAEWEEMKANENRVTAEINRKIEELWDLC